MTEDEYSRIENGELMGEAILFMKSRKPNPDGTIGYMVKPDTLEWDEWLRYFKWNDMRRQHGMMQSRWTKPEGYMVPHRSPQVFDPAYRPRMAEPAERPRMAAELTAAERDAIAERAKAAVKFVPAKSAKYTAPDLREGPPKMPEARELTEAEAASMRRLMGVPEPKEQEAAE